MPKKKKILLASKSLHRALRFDSSLKFSQDSQGGCLNIKHFEFLIFFFF